MAPDNIHVFNKENLSAVAEHISSELNIDNAKVFDFINLFLNIDKHMTKAEMADFMTKNDLLLSEDDVSNILNGLNDFGLLLELDVPGGDKRYEPFTLKHHHHLVCLKCGCVSEFHDDAMRSHYAKAFKSKGFKPLSHTLEVFGLCDNCQEELKKSFDLSFAVEGSNVHIKRIEGGKEFANRLMELGFISKECIKVIKNSGSGPVVVEVKGSRIALGRNEAKKVLVDECK